MAAVAITSAWEWLESSADSTGLLSLRPGGDPRTDAMAWAVMAWHAHGRNAERAGAVCGRLSERQASTGAVGLIGREPSLAWPTPLALLAWNATGHDQRAIERGAAFLLAITGRHYEPGPDAVVGHNTALRGWPWVAATHSWVEPTAMALLALQRSGHGGHERAREAREMVLDRQLSGGGWNYGNTMVFGTELRPVVESTAMALAALADWVEASRVERSLDFLRAQLPALRTPLSLSWGIIACDLWRSPWPDAALQIERAMARPVGQRPYNTVELGQLLVAASASPRELFARP